MLLEDMNISRLMTHAQWDEQLRKITKVNKKARMDYYEYSHQKLGNRNPS